MIHVSEPEDFVGMWWDEDWEQVAELLPEGTCIRAAQAPNHLVSSIAVETTEHGDLAVCVLQDDSTAPSGLSWSVSVFSSESPVFCYFHENVVDVPGEAGRSAGGVLRWFFKEGFLLGKWNPPMYRTRYVEQPKLESGKKSYDPDDYAGMALEDQLHYNWFASGLDAEFQKRWEAYEARNSGWKEEGQSAA